MFNPSLMMRLVESAEKSDMMMYARVWSGLLLPIGFIHLALMISFVLSPFASSTLRRCLSSLGLKEIGTFGMIRLYDLSVICEPSAKATVNSISISGWLIQMTVSLLFKVSTSASLWVLKSVWTLMSFGFLESLIALMALLALVVNSVKLFPNTLVPSRPRCSMRICLPLHSMSPKTLGSVLALRVCVGLVRTVS